MSLARTDRPMLKLFLAALLPSLLALPVLVIFADEAPPRRAATPDRAVDPAAGAGTLLAMAPADERIAPRSISHP